jgi:hypothetical protein
MEEKSLQDLILTIEEEIKAPQSINEKDKELLIRLKTEIQEFLSKDEENKMSIHPTLIEKLQEGVDHLEASHPKITSIISQILDSLSGAGI